jgi:hypothetical protein
MVVLPPASPSPVPPPTPIGARAIPQQVSPIPQHAPLSFSQQKQRIQQRRARKEYVRSRRERRGKRVDSVGEGRINVVDNRGGVVNIVHAGNKGPIHIGNSSFVIGSPPKD